MKYGLMLNEKELEYIEMVMGVNAKLEKNFGETGNIEIHNEIKKKIDSIKEITTFLKFKEGSTSIGGNDEGL